MAKKTVEVPVEESREQKVARLSAQIMANDAPQSTVPDIDVDAPSRETSSRSTMKGFIKWGMMTAPFKMYSGTKTEALYFNNCCPECSGKVNSVTTCKACNVAFEGEGSKGQLKKGYAVGGTMVFVEKAELEACEPSSNEVVEVIQFVKFAEIDPIFFESTNLLSADKGGEKVLTLLRAAMEETDSVAVVKITQRGRENSAILRPYQQEDGGVGIAVTYLYFDHEVRNANFSTPAQLSPEEISFARQLADAMTDSFAPKSLQDTYAVNVRKLIASKVAGVTAPTVAKATKPAPVSDLMSALKASMADAEVNKAKRNSKAKTA